MQNQIQYCQVILKESTRQFDREYTYSVPSELRGKLFAGSHVEVPFGRANRTVEAYVIALANEDISDFYIKPVIRLISERPVLTKDQIQLAAMMRQRYLCTYGAAVRCMTPSTVLAVGDKKVRFAELCDPSEAAERLASGEIDRLGHIRVIQMLLDYGSAPAYEIQSACQVSPAILKTLEKKGLIFFSRQEVRRLSDDDNLQTTVVADFEPNESQKNAINRIDQAMRETFESGTGQEFLLYGITGSGKTEVYLQTARIAINSGKDVIILVPEISLTPQMISRIRSRFGDNVAVLHSRLTPAERYEQWQRILRREVNLVVGARSAIFAPLQNPGLIIIDEEQESSYKSETHPRYHARDIARMRSHMHGAALILGSATPSVESFYRSCSGKSILLTMSERIGSAGLPEVEIVDMREELRAGNRGIFSNALQNALAKIRSENHQAMIFINRRGYAGFVLCRNCGHVVKCNSCSVSLTSHASLSRQAEYTDSAQIQNQKNKDLLICHYCGKISKTPEVCPICSSKMIGRFGAGTQQVEELFARQFPDLRTLRMDQDTTGGRTAHADILHKFANHEADVLIGTQMIAKGHDFPDVTVVGILAADQLLGISDFRASERAFQLILQASGRAGRASRAGKVIIQAYNTDDYAIQAAASQNYMEFYEQEIAFRRIMKYPPFGSIGLIVLSGTDDNLVKTKIEHLYKIMTKWQSDHADYPEISLMEPARAPLQRIRKRYRWRLVMQADNYSIISSFIGITTERFDFGELAVTIDVDPWQML